jgi:hypothetical protein
MSLTHAERHVDLEKKGEWRTSARLKRCSRYFGDLACCARAIPAGTLYFDTQDTVPDAGIRQSFAVCANCANTPHSADFLKERTS